MSTTTEDCCITTTQKQCRRQVYDIIGSDTESKYHFGYTSTVPPIWQIFDENNQQIGVSSRWDEEQGNISLNYGTPLGAGKTHKIVIV